MSGCIWSLIPFPILIALYSVIRQPLTRMMFVAEDVVTTLQDFFVNQGWYTVPSKTDAYVEIKLADIAHQHWDEVQTALAGQVDGLMNIDFGFLGLNLGQKPEWNFFMHTDWSDVAVWLPVLGLHEDQQHDQSFPGAERPGRGFHEEHDPDDAPDEHLDLLCHACRHGYLLDCQLHFWHHP